MEIVGNGFLARNLKSIEAAHPGVLVAAIGVSAAGNTAQREFSREAERLYNLIHRCRETGEKLLFFSTASTGMYSIPGGPGMEDGPVFPATPYGRHKLALESVLATADIDYLVLRLGHVIGPKQPAHQLLPALVTQVRTGSVRIFTGTRRDLIDVVDVVTIISLLLDAGVSRTRVNVASGFPAPIERIVEHVQRRLGVRATWRNHEHSPDQPISTAKLCRLVPAIATMGFGADYYIRVLDRYIPADRRDALAAPIISHQS